MAEEHTERMTREAREVEKLKRQKQELQEEQKSMQQECDIRSVLASSRAGGGGGEADESGSFGSTGGHHRTRSGLSDEAESTLQELEEQLVNVQTELQFKQDRIQVMKQKDSENIEDAQDDDVVSKIQVHSATLPQAHTWIRLLFNTLVSMKRTTKGRKQQVQVLLEELQMVKDEGEKRKLTLEQMQLSHDDEVRQIGSETDDLATRVSIDHLETTLLMICRN